MTTPEPAPPAQKMRLIPFWQKLLLGVAFAFMPFGMTMCVDSCATPAAHVLCEDGSRYDLVFERETHANNRLTTNWRIHCHGAKEEDQPGVFLSGVVQILTFVPFGLALALLITWGGIPQKTTGNDKRAT